MHGAAFELGPPHCWRGLGPARSFTWALHWLPLSQRVARTAKFNALVPLQARALMPAARHATVVPTYRGGTMGCCQSRSAAVYAVDADDSGEGAGGQLLLEQGHAGWQERPGTSSEAPARPPHISKVTSDRDELEEFAWVKGEAIGRSHVSVQRP